MKLHQEQEISKIIETLPRASVELISSTSAGAAFGFRLYAPAEADAPRIPRSGAGRRSSIVVTKDEQVLEMRLRFPGVETDFPERRAPAREAKNKMEAEHEQRMAETLGYEAGAASPDKHPSYIEFEAGVAVPHFVISRLGEGNPPALMQVISRVEEALEAHAQAAYGMGYGAAR